MAKKISLFGNPLRSVIAPLLYIWSQVFVAVQATRKEQKDVATMTTTRRIALLLLAATLAVSAAQVAASEDSRAVIAPAMSDNTDVLGADAAAAALPGVDAIARLKQIYRCKARKLEETGTDCKILIVSAPPITGVRG